MKVEKWGDTFAVRIPADVAAAMGLREGDEVEIASLSSASVPTAESESERTKRVAEAFAALQALAATADVPKGWKFNREEIYEERLRELGW